MISCGRGAIIGAFPLSAQQDVLLAIDSGRHGGLAMITPLCFVVHGPLDPAALRRAVARLVTRHEPLRTVFPLATPGAPRAQVILDAGPAPVAVMDEPAAGAGPAHPAVSPHARRVLETPFDVTSGPLFRLAVLRGDDGRHLLLAAVHLLAADGWSLRVLFSDLGALYRAEAGGPDPGLPPLEIQYVDWAAWQRSRTPAAGPDNQLRLWSAPLADLPLAPPATAGEPTGRRIRADADPELAAAVERCGQRLRATPFTVCAAAWARSWALRCGLRQITLRSPVAGRERPEVQHIAGFLAGMVQVPVSRADDPDFPALVARVRSGFAAAVGAAENGAAPAASWPLPDESGYAVHFSLRTSRVMPGLNLAGCRVSPVPVLIQASKFGFGLIVDYDPDGLSMLTEFDTAAVSPDDARDIIGHYRHVLYAACAAG
jgi:hypothetical protein